MIRLAAIDTGEYSDVGFDGPRLRILLAAPITLGTRVLFLVGLGRYAVLRCLRGELLGRLGDYAVLRDRKGEDFGRHVRVSSVGREWEVGSSSGARKSGWRDRVGGPLERAEKMLRRSNSVGETRKNPGKPEKIR